MYNGYHVAHGTLKPMIKIMSVHGHESMQQGCTIISIPAGSTLGHAAVSTVDDISDLSLMALLPEVVV